MAGIESVEVYRDAGQAAEPDLMRTLHCQRSEKDAYDINPSVDCKELSQLSMRQTALAMFR